MKWTEALNIAGSIASISGVSLLWLRTYLPNVATPGLVAGLVGTLAGALLTIGLITLAIELLDKGSRWPMVGASARAKTIYWTFSGAVALVVLSFLIAMLWAYVVAAWSIQ